MKQSDLLELTTHGTLAGYVAGCRGRCEAVISCTDVKVRYAGDYAFKKALDAGQNAVDIVRAEQEAARVAKIHIIPETVTHGTISTYNVHKCRCEPCREAKSQKVARLRAEKKRTTSRPSASSFAVLNEARIRELHAQGLTDRLIGERLGMSAATIWTARQHFELPSNAKPQPKKDHTAEHAEYADRVKELHARGLDDGRIAADIGRSRYFVRGLRSACGLKGISGKPVVLAEHGTIRRAWQKCTCGPCAEVKRAYYQERYQMRKAKVAA